MLFLNSMLLIGTAAIAIPIVIHLLNRQTNRIIDWGAMNFLLESLAIRSRRIQLEEALLMACRCLLVGLLALALARPFIPPTSTIPWMVILPLALLGIVGLGVATVLQNEPRWRKWIFIGSVLALLTCVALVVFEKYLNLSRFGPGGRQDIALIIDGSSSMTMTPTEYESGETNFERAIEEARTIIKRAPRGDAFSLILGGPTPNARILEPTTDRAELKAMLDDLEPLDGPMATYNSFTLAALSLTRGQHAAKQIILISDGQSVGWETGKPDRWNFLRDAFRNLPVEPQITMRTLPLPKSLRNLAVTEVALSREIVGVDRPVEVTVTIENTGDEAVTPTSIDLYEGDLKVASSIARTIQPQGKETLTFEHQFQLPGAIELRAAIEVDDEIVQDNSRPYALNVADRLRVLIVDGRPSGRFFERAGTFPALALAPSALTLYPEKAGMQNAMSDDVTFDDNAASYDPNYDPVQFLVEPSILSAGELSTITDFSPYDAVILADVPRLAAESTEALVGYVTDGGGLLIAPGTRIEPSFYNAWADESDLPFLPAAFESVAQVAVDGETWSPSKGSLSHPVLAKVARRKGSDFADTQYQSYWPLSIPEARSAESSIGGKLTDGAPLLVSRQAGRGSIVMLSTALDQTGGNFTTRQSYLPFVHELTYHLANPAAYDLNLEPGWEVALHLGGTRGSVLGEGLQASYYSPRDKKEPVMTRVDPSIQFHWQSGSPGTGVGGDNFRVRWEGSIQVPRHGSYRFEGDVDDALEVKIDGETVFTVEAGKRPKISNHKLEGGRWYPFEAEFNEYGGDATAVLYYESRSAKVQRQIIPSSAFRTLGEVVPSGPGIADATLTRFDVTGPGGKTREAALESAEGGSVLKIQGDISAGAYDLHIPEDQRDFFRQFLGESGDRIPFTVKRDAAESYLDRLTEPDFLFLSQYVSLAQPETIEELLSILSGRQYGRELWKYLALGAFLFLLIEIALSRWIAHSRRSGEEISIDFQSKEAPTTGFKKQLARLGKTTA